MTSRDIQRAILLDRYHNQTVFPNFTPSGWFECDVFCLSRAGYWTEFEIKVSRGDFRADADKAPEIHEITEGQWVTRKGESKHQRLARADTTGPSRFFFVTPAGMIEQAEVPDWAGLIHAHQQSSISRITCEIIKPAPRLHQSKANPQHLTDIHTAAYWRFIRSLITRKADS